MQRERYAIVRPPRRPGERLAILSRSVAALCALSLAACGGPEPPRARPEAVAAYIAAASDYEAGRLESAASGASSAARADRSFLPAFVLLGKASYFLGDDEAAIRALERGLELTPRAGSAALWLSRAYRAADRGPEAEALCERILASDPSDVAALRLSAILALEASDGGAAFAFLDRAVEAAAETGLAFADRAALLWAAGDGPGALADLDAAIAVLPAGSASRAAALDLRSSIGSDGR